MFNSKKLRGENPTICFSKIEVCIQSPNGDLFWHCQKKKNNEINETIIIMKISKITKCEYINFIQNFERKENIWNFSENSDDYSRLKLDLKGYLLRALGSAKQLVFALSSHFSSSLRF